MELTGNNKDDILNLITRQIEQEMLLNVAKEQLGVRNGADVILFLAYYDRKYTEATVRDGKKFWQLSDEGKKFLDKGGFSKQKERDLKDKRIFYAVVIVLLIVVFLFIWSEFRLF